MTNENGDSETKTTEIGFGAGMAAIGSPIDLNSTLDMIYEAVDN